MPQITGKRGKMLGGWIDGVAKSGPELAHQARFLLPELVPLLLLYLISADEPDVPVKAIRSS